MDSITLQRVLPNVFRERTDIHSEVWLADVTFSRGKTYLIEAASGTGKSSLFAYLLGYRRDYSGIISFDGADVSRYSVSQWTEQRRSHLAMLFQELRLFPELTAMENVQIKNQLSGHKTEDEIRRWFERLGIADKVDAKAGRMSFGQQQRVALLRALVQPFDFLLADEPVSHLDEANSNVMAELMREEADRQGAAILLSSIGKHPAMHYDHVFKL